MIYDEELDDIDRYDRLDMWTSFVVGGTIGFALGLLLGAIL